eukprot:Em0008g326a
MTSTVVCLILMAVQLVNASWALLANVVVWVQLANVVVWVQLANEVCQSTMMKSGQHWDTPVLRNGRVVCGSIAVAVVPITGTCVPVATDEAWAAMVGGSAVQVGPSTFTEMGKWIGGTGWPIHTFAEMVGGSVSVDSSTFSEVVAESAVDTFAKVVGRSAVAFAEAWAISMIGGTTPGACSVVDGAGEIDIAGSLLPAFYYETMYCLSK